MLVYVNDMLNKIQFNSSKKFKNLKMKSIEFDPFLAH